MFSSVAIEQPVVDVPLCFGSGTFDPDDTAGTSKGGSPSRAGQGRTVLVVDDDLANLALAQALLQAEGFEVRVAIDAVSTADVLKSWKPSVILMDIQLPEVDGWELTRRLKSDPATADIPVIAVTAYGNRGDAARARAAGFADFVAKPIDTRTLPDLVRRHARGNEPGTPS